MKAVYRKRPSLQSHTSDQSLRRSKRSIAPRPRRHHPSGEARAQTPLRGATRNANGSKDTPSRRHGCILACHTLYHAENEPSQSAVIRRSDLRWHTRLRGRGSERAASSARRDEHNPEEGLLWFLGAELLSGEVLASESYLDGTLPAARLECCKLGRQRCANTGRADKDTHL